MIVKNRIKSLIIKLRCPLISAFIQIAVICYGFSILVPYLSGADKLQSAENRDRIAQKASSVIKQIGHDYFLNWIIVETSNQKERYRFQDILECKRGRGKDCVSSVKHLNDFYSETHYLDRCTYELLDSMDTGDVRIYSDLDKLKKCQTISTILEQGNLPLKGAGMTVIKNLERNIVYIFVLTSLIDIDLNKKKVSILLREMSITARKNL